MKIRKRWHLAIGAGLAALVAGGVGLAPFPASAVVGDTEAEQAAAKLARSPVTDRVVHGVGVDLAVRVVGSPWAPTTVIALSGGPGLSGDYMRAFEKPLASAAVRVVTWDQRGTGRSTTPADGDYSIKSYIADLDAVRSSLGARQVVLLGHSWGGLYALAYTSAHPERVKALGLVDAAPANGTEMAAANDRFEARLSRLVDAGTIRQPLPEVVNDDCGPQIQALLPVYFANPKFVPPPHSLDGTCTQSVTNGTFAALTTQEFTKITIGLQRYHGPALILYGAEDPFGVQFVTEQQRELPNARVTVRLVPGAGHFPWLEQPMPSIAAIRNLVH